MGSLSKLIIKTIEHNNVFKIIGTKVNNNWHWTDRSELHNLISNCITTLDNYNIKKGDRVAYKGKNSKEWVAWNIATNSLGAIWVPMYQDQNLDYCKHIINDCSPKLLINENKLEYLDNITTISNDIRDLKYYSDIDITYNDISTLIYTSGTTGKPKGVMLSNENIISNITGIRNIFNDIGPTTSLNILPWAHIYSQTCELYYNLLYDNKTAICSNKNNFLDDCKEINPDVLYVVPKLLDLIKSKLDNFNKPIIKYIIPILLNRLFGNKLLNIFTGGSKLDNNTKNFFIENGINICEGYGCTETAPMISVNHIISPRNIDSVGYILDNLIVDIINNEICVSGPNVMQGYWNNEKATNDVFIVKDNKKWYRTGDSGKLNNNFLFYNSRINDNYKLSNGKFVNVEEVESKIKKHIKGNFIVFGDDTGSNSIITEININNLDLINKELDSYLRIKKIYKINPEELVDFLTPKMTIKRKALINYVLSHQNK